MQSHAQAPELASYQEFKSHIEKLKKCILNHKRQATEIKLDPDLSNGVINNFLSIIKACEKRYPAYASQYYKEKYKPITDAKKERNQYALVLSAAVICCLPSYLLTLFHCCLSPSSPNDFEPCGEIGDRLTPFRPCGNGQTPSEMCPSLNFFFKPITVINEKSDEIRLVNQEIKELQNSLEADEAAYQPAPRPQSMS